jgi:hypothetical protein
MSARHLAALVVGSALLMASLSAVAQQVDGAAPKAPPAAAKPTKAAAATAAPEAAPTKTVQRSKTPQPTPASTKTPAADARHEGGGCQAMKDSDA